MNVTLEWFKKSRSKKFATNFCLFLFQNTINRTHEFVQIQLPAGHFVIVLRLGRYFVEMHSGNVLETTPFSQDVTSTILVFPPKQ